MAARRTGVQIRADAAKGLQAVHANHATLVTNKGALGGHIAGTRELMGESGDARTSADVNKINVALADIMGRQVDAVVSQIVMAPDEFAEGVARLFPSSDGLGGIDFAAFGLAVSGYFREAPTRNMAYHLLGPFEAGPKVAAVRAVAQRRVKVKEELEQTQVQDAAEIAATQGAAGAGGAVNASAEGQNAKRHDVLFKDLREYQAAHGRTVRVSDLRPIPGTRPREFDWDGAVPLVDALFCPFSYTETVENIFYFSFLVKLGFAAVYQARPHLPPAGADAAAAAGASVRLGVEEPYIRVLTQDEYKVMLSSGLPVGARETGNAARVMAAQAPADGKLARAAMKQRENAEQQAVKEGRNTQWALEVDPDSWRRIIAAKGLKKPGVRHRAVCDCTGCGSYAHQTDPLESDMARAGMGTGVVLDKDDNVVQNPLAAGAAAGGKAAAGRRAKRKSAAAAGGSAGGGKRRKAAESDDDGAGDEDAD